MRFFLCNRSYIGNIRSLAHKNYFWTSEILVLKFADMSSWVLGYCLSFITRKTSNISNYKQTYFFQGSAETWEQMQSFHPRSSREKKEWLAWWWVRQAKTAHEVLRLIEETLLDLKISNINNHQPSWITRQKHGMLRCEFFSFLFEALRGKTWLGLLTFFLWASHL